MGIGALAYDTTGSSNVALGWFSGYHCTAGNNTYLGDYAGFSHTPGSNSVFLGYEAGYNETASNVLYIDNQNISSNDSSKALIYGTFNATAHNQSLALNAGTLNLGAGGDAHINTRRLALSGIFSLPNVDITLTNAYQSVDMNTIGSSYWHVSPTSSGYSIVPTNTETGDIVFVSNFTGTAWDFVTSEVGYVTIAGGATHAFFYTQNGSWIQIF